MKEQTIDALMAFISAVQNGFLKLGLDKNTHPVEHLIISRTAFELINALGEENISREEEKP